MSEPIGGIGAIKRIGIIYCGYRCAEYLHFLDAWVKARTEKLGGYEWLICAISCPFESFDNGPEDGTKAQLEARLVATEIDHLLASEEPQKETEARSAALEWLVSRGCDTLLQIDADEDYKASEIERIFSFAARFPHVSWFRGCFKNYIGDNKTYIVEPFRPARIHRVYQPGGYVAAGFWDDNNVYYARPWSPADTIKDVTLPSMDIPKSIAFVAHYTWPNSLRGKRKSEYQWARWNGCSFSWDAKQGLIWTPGRPIPETAID